MSLNIISALNLKHSFCAFGDNPSATPDAKWGLRALCSHTLMLGCLRRSKYAMTTWRSTSWTAAAAAAATAKAGVGILGMHRNHDASVKPLSIFDTVTEEVCPVRTLQLVHAA